MAHIQATYISGICCKHRSCNMSTVHRRLTSRERDLWWDIDTSAAARTGCRLPCRYELYDTEELEHEYDGFTQPFEQGAQFALQVGGREGGRVRTQPMLASLGAHHRWRHQW